MDGSTTNAPVSREAVNAQLARLFEHRLFRTSLALQRFLEYVVEEEFAGRGHEIKAYSIALSALERPESFDPQIDPIVRVTGSKLRGNLNLYYATDGLDDPVRIDIPKGTYRPVITPQGNPAESPAGPAPVPARMRRTIMGGSHAKCSVPQWSSANRSVYSSHG